MDRSKKGLLPRAFGTPHSLTWTLVAFGLLFRSLPHLCFWNRQINLNPHMSTRSVLSDRLRNLEHGITRFVPRLTPRQRDELLPRGRTNGAVSGKAMISNIKFNPDYKAMIAVVVVYKG